MIVADASALYKLVVEERHSKFVRETFEKESSSGEPVVVPDLAVSEVLNIAWVDYKLRKNLSSNAFESALASFDKIFGDLEVIPAVLLKDVAVKISLLKNLTVYDSMYVSASLLRGASLFSFDVKMCKAAAELGVGILRPK